METRNAFRSVAVMGAAMAMALPHGPRHLEPTQRGDRIKVEHYRHTGSDRTFRAERRNAMFGRKAKGNTTPVERRAIWSAQGRPVPAHGSGPAITNPTAEAA